VYLLLDRFNSLLVVEKNTERRKEKNPGEKEINLGKIKVKQVRARA
jgi:hypothetical protein